MTNRFKKPVNITLPTEVKEQLQLHAAEKGLSVSGILSALAKIYCNMKLTCSAEKSVEADIKRAVERSTFIAFLQLVNSEVTPYHAKPIVTGWKDAECEPESWIIGKNGILAFPNPIEENNGLLFMKATGFKNSKKLTRVFVIVPDSSVVQPPFKRDLSRLSIDIMQISELRYTLSHLH